MMKLLPKCRLTPEGLVVILLTISPLLGVLLGILTGFLAGQRSVP